MHEPFQIPAGWENRVREFVRGNTGGQRDWISCSEFSDDLLLRFPDGSVAFFNFAFVLRDDAAGEMAVFTEHCGYFAFPSEGVQATVVKSMRYDSPA